MIQKKLSIATQIKSMIISLYIILTPIPNEGKIKIKVLTTPNLA